MILYSNKKRFSIRVLSFVVLAGLSFSLFPSARNLEQKSVIEKQNKNGSKDIANKELNYKLDILKIEQVLDSVEFLQDYPSIIGDNEWEELEIDNILENWKKYQKTKFDAWGIKKLLKHAPAGSKEFIKLLVENDDAFDKLNEIIDCLIGCQDALFAYWDTSNILHYDAKSLYYSIFQKILPKVNNKLNSSSLALECSQALGILKPVLNLFALLGFTGLANGYIFSKLFNSPFSWKKSIINGLKRPIYDHTIFPAVYKDEYDFAQLNKAKADQFLTKGTLGDRYIIDKFLFKYLLRKVSTNNRLNNIIAGSAAATFEGGLLAWRDYKTYTGFKGSITKIVFLHKTAEKLQNSLVNVADLIKSLEGLGALGKGDEDAQDNYIIKNIGKYKQSQETSSDVKRLFEFLVSSTFEAKASYLYSRGRLLSAHHLLLQVKDELIPLMQNIALLGGYRAIAHMIRDHKNARVGFCFVKPGVTSNGGPMVKMKKAWLPLIGADVVITNDVHLGIEGGPLNAIVTGPNGGGKSTFMITVAFNVLLARLGIVAADEAEIAEFAQIRTSLRPQQDIKSGLSAFMAEHKRVAQVKKCINNCDGNILVLLDEPYKGTVEVESASRVYKFGKEIAAKSHCMLLLATHLRKPIELQADTAGIFTNYQMGYIETKSTLFKRTFKILDGPAIWWFDDAEKRSRFIDWLCEQEIES